MKTITEFLTYWQTHSQPDAGLELSKKYHAVEDQIKNLQTKSLSYIIPIKGAKETWLPGFDPDKMDALAKIAVSLEGSKKELESISKAIEEFISVVDGLSLSPLVNEYTGLCGRLEHQRKSFETILAEARESNFGMPQPQLLKLRKVADADASLQQAKATLEPQINEVKNRIQKALTIVGNS